MKIIKTKITTIHVDLEKERQIIRDFFGGRYSKYRKPLIEVIDTFEKDGYDAAFEKYLNLPYNEDDEYPLQESMGVWWHNIHGDLLYNRKANVTIDTKLEIIK